MDLIIRNAKILEVDERVDIGIQEGKITSVSKEIHERAEEELDAKGKLVLPTFIEPHIHLDKVLLAEKLKEAGSISEARQMVRDAKKGFTKREVFERIEKVVPWGIENGVTIIRTHIDVDGYSKTTSMEAVLEIRKKFKDLVDIQIVAFPQEGFVSDSIALDYVRKALELGADLLGGLPEAERTEEDSRKHLDELFTLAREKDVDLDVHCDVLPQLRNIEYFAALVKQNHYERRATADHLIALSYYDDEFAQKIIRLLAENEINVVTNPCTMISGGPTERPPKARGITRVKELVEGGVNVAFGSDNIVDPYNPFGDMNPLSNGFLLAYGAQMNSGTDFQTLIRMPTYNSARVLRLQNYGVNIGDHADLNIFCDSTPRELLRLHGKPRYVIKKGRVLAVNEIETVRKF
jgi:cytosine deaminase